MTATLDLLDALPRSGLSTGHAGIASGQLVSRDGDIFGRTVNLAARIADAAPDGRLWVTREVRDSLPREAFQLTEVTGVTLQGIDAVRLTDVSRRALPTEDVGVPQRPDEVAREPEHGQQARDDVGA